MLDKRIDEMTSKGQRPKKGSHIAPTSQEEAKSGNGEVVGEIKAEEVSPARPTPTLSP